MFNFWQKKELTRESGIDHRGYIDIHCHILPGVDDGPASIAESLDMAREAADNGVSHIVATPHLNRELFAVSTQARESAFSQLQEALAGTDIPIALFLGSEVRARPHLTSALNEAGVMLAGGRYILLEFPFDFIPPFARDLVFNLQVAGATPILAHPERNSALQNDIKRLEPFLEAGCLTQINSSSLTGLLGTSSRKTAVRLLEAGWAHILASDAHQAGSRGPNFKEAVTLAAKYIGVEAAQKLVRDNPAMVLESLDARE